MQSSTSKDDWTAAYILVLLIPIGFVAAAVFWCFSARRRRQLDARRNQHRDVEVAVSAAAATRDTPLRFLPREAAAHRGPKPSSPPHPTIPSRALLSNSVSKRNQHHLLATHHHKAAHRLPNTNLLTAPDPALASRRKHGSRRHYCSGREEEEKKEQRRNNQPSTTPPQPSSSSPSDSLGDVSSPALRHRHDVPDCDPRRRREHHKKVAALRRMTEVLEEASEEGSVSSGGWGRRNDTREVRQNE
ncbi:uncharacterized protein B0T15DRAFT_491051 [Chaetomium strumarium]|uniref:Uncharacterized protein n=1 Tax=Chaetomium strumarium TaxID=1170767 RepID=A0AAJ0GYJ0_9PEZI|nr:hypothetical protein B0T15DRAFT_491051 [Chaetomium strumarium]